MKRIWPWTGLSRRDFAGALLLVFFLLVALLGAVLGPVPKRWTNFGFGPEWDCEVPGHLAGLNCIKHAPWFPANGVGQN